MMPGRSRQERPSQMSKNDLVVVTGAGGFIGGHLVRVLQQRGHSRIRAVDVKPLPEWCQKTPGVENQVGDLALLEPCRAAAKGARMIYNLAADMGGMGFIETHKAECMLSVLVSTHMLVAAKEAGTERFFYSSSACVYNGDKQTRTDVTALKEEDAYPAMPEDGYGWEKLFSEPRAPPLSRGLRHRHPGRPLPQRLRPPRHLRRRPREGAGRDLPQGDRRQARGQARDRDLGRRRADPLVHVYRRLHRRHDPPGAERNRRAAKYRQRRTGKHQTAGRHRREERPPRAQALLQARRAQGRARPQQRQHPDQEVDELGAFHPSREWHGEDLQVDPRRDDLRQGLRRQRPAARYCSGVTIKAPS